MVPRRQDESRLPSHQTVARDLPDSRCLRLPSTLLKSNDAGMHSVVSEEPELHRMLSGAAPALAGILMKRICKWAVQQ